MAGSNVHHRNEAEIEAAKNTTGRQLALRIGEETGEQTGSCQTEGQAAGFSPQTAADEEEAEARFMLTFARGVGTHRFYELLEWFGSARRCLSASDEQRAEVVGVEVARIRTAVLSAAATAEKRKLAELGARLIVLGQPGYPGALARVPEPPPAIRAFGDLSPLAGSGRLEGVAIVGQRAATRCGRDRAFAIAEHLATEGYSIVSGGAYGIDACAHRGALETGGHTVCVLGSSLDRPYPTRNIPLFRQILEAGGAVISPFPISTEPHRGCFLGRNRVVAGMSRAVVVVEAGARSGARSTAIHARKMGRALFACPGSTGTARLLAEGARGVDAGPQVVELLAQPADRPQAGGPDPLAGLPAPKRALLVEAARCPDLTADSLARRCGVGLSETIGLLMELELDGLVVTLSGGRYRSTATIGGEPHGSGST
jgi:DNA processing protein